ncbi:MAG TPA: hypothetical protein VD903_15765 [Pseudonocardia sp.]|nr:hypothetical protein [Pseudonocardia sp.]
MSNPTPNTDPYALPTEEPVAPGRPASEAQVHPPVWDSHPKHHRWDYVAEMGGWTHDQDPDTLCNSVGAIPFQPTFAYPPPHPRCLLGDCRCGATR